MPPARAATRSDSTTAEVKLVGVSSVERPERGWRRTASRLHTEEAEGAERLHPDGRQLAKGRGAAPEEGKLAFLIRVTQRVHGLHHDRNPTGVFLGLPAAVRRDGDAVAPARPVASEARASQLPAGDTPPRRALLPPLCPPPPERTAVVRPGSQVSMRTLVRRVAGSLASSYKSTVTSNGPFVPCTTLLSCRRSRSPGNGTCGRRRAAGRLHPSPWRSVRPARGPIAAVTTRTSSQASFVQERPLAQRVRRTT